jgi:hypothetical protein
MNAKDDALRPELAHSFSSLVAHVKLDSRVFGLYHKGLGDQLGALTRGLVREKEKGQEDDTRQSQWDANMLHDAPPPILDVAKDELLPRWFHAVSIKGPSTSGQEEKGDSVIGLIFRCKSSPGNVEG